jgi:hypothetical protein
MSSFVMLLWQKCQTGAVQVLQEAHQVYEAVDFVEST